MFYAGSCSFHNVPLTVVAVLVLAAVDGSIRLHLQVEALLAEQSCHDAFQLRLWNAHTRTPPTHTHTHTYTQTMDQTTAPSPPRICQSSILTTVTATHQKSGCLSLQLRVCTLTAVLIKLDFKNAGMSYEQMFHKHKMYGASSIKATVEDGEYQASTERLFILYIFVFPVRYFEALKNSF